jgi:hypothetical protein
MMRKFWILLLIATGVLLCGPEKGRAGSALPIAYQIPLLMKLVTYEFNLMGQPRPTIVIGVLYRPEDPGSRGCFESFEAQFKERRDLVIRGHRLELVGVPIRSEDSLRLPAGHPDIDILYVAPGNEERIPAISRWTRGMKSLSVTGSEDSVEQGLSVALFSSGVKESITINLPASLEEGREWNVNVLQVARVIR